MRRVVVAAAETRSFERAEVVIRGVADLRVLAKTVERVVKDVGPELAARRDADPRRGDALATRPEAPPELAVVECDGGRIRTREPGHGPGVHGGGEGWRETKNAVFIRATRVASADDPQPEPPACFGDHDHVAKIVATQALSAAAAGPPAAGPPGGSRPGDGPEADGPAAGEDWRPERLVRTVLSSMADSKGFGRQMRREATRRRFHEAKAKAFLGDGLPWNWTIHEEHFGGFTPILDFIHPLSYLHAAARAVHESPANAWDQYLAWMGGAWRGEVDQVLEELRAWRAKLGEPAAGAPEADPRKVVATTIGYLENNRGRMKYPEYRCPGMPVTTAWMESLVKKMNYRVKGTELF
ncbi:hypothetical protein [Aquisphaera giovannonii]|uniref:hypothetical protein n=1 Tax=Aquisphaera giovannonii TaxID=406548 RepID=UPI001AEFCB3F|nr:hypothetical protein [Aquisphaera giovannonii]